MSTMINYIFMGNFRALFSRSLFLAHSSSLQTLSETKITEQYLHTHTYTGICRYGEFHCANGECIPMESRCNGKSNIVIFEGIFFGNWFLTITYSLFFRRTKRMFRWLRRVGLSPFWNPTANLSGKANSPAEWRGNLSLPWRGQSPNSSALDPSGQCRYGRRLATDLSKCSCP